MKMWTYDQGGGGRIIGLASLNTTREDWNKTGGQEELDRLKSFLEMHGFVGTKLAPLHTCLQFDLDIMSQTAATIGNTPINGQPGVAYIHFGTIMEDIFLRYHGCCGPEYVDPYNNVTFILVHTGADYLSLVYQ
jgi:hypothetical protein